MEIALLVLIPLLACAILAGLAALIRVVLVYVANKNGYTAANMPIHYHMFAFGVYFSIVLVVVAFGVWT
jgi:hypothetical protein